ncbi:hypothetical protein [Salinispora cortesiana]|uniref:hypothetical protein n=1 Tax=Salinispora cortesiana TaxID=1305843 RepID=UPI000470A642|nr:hypothetical protein [Salinispora cortesiana]
MTNRRVPLPPKTPRRAAGLLVGLALGAAVLAGCGSSDGVSTDCGLDGCMVTFDREANAEASILGVQAKLIGAQDDQVTVEVAGEQLTLTTGQPAAEVGGLSVTLDNVSADQVAIRLAQGSGG